MDTNRTPNHICKCCGQPYYSCDSCQKRNSWRSVCDTENHYQIYTTVILADRGIYPKAQAKSILEGLDLSEQSNFKESIQRRITDILADKTNDFNRSDADEL